MNLFRKQTPRRREGRAMCAHYESYREDLRQDFNQRCGYCDDSDKIRIRSFAIDHFVPQRPDGFTHNIPPNDYYNLVYSCRYCNSAKSNKWPTKDAMLHNDGCCGFLEPTDQQYTERFKRIGNGRIVPRKENDVLAQYIIDELKLWLPVHEYMWKFEKIKELHITIGQHLKTIADAEEYKQAKDLHYELSQELIKIQDNIFVENE